MVPFHPSFNELIDSFGTMIAALTWLRSTPAEAQRHFASWHCIITFDCTVSDKSIKVDKSAFVAFQADAVAPGTPLFASTLANLCRVVTISVRDIIAEHPDFSAARNEELFQFLRHIRSAAAHENHSILAPEGSGTRHSPDCRYNGETRQSMLPWRESSCFMAFSALATCCSY